MRQAGLTLIEVLITVALISILTLTAFINLFSYRERQDLKQATQGLIVVLRDAQNRSISQDSGNRWGVYFENPSAGEDFYDLFWGASYASTSVASHVVLPTNLRFDAPGEGTTTSVIFSPVTGLPGASTTIKLSLLGEASASSTIIVEGNGQITF